MNIPQGHQAVMPYLIMDDADAFMTFVKAVFSAEVTHESRNENGRLGHCEIRISGSTIMFSNSTDQWKASTVSLFVYVEDADTAFHKAVEAGGIVILPLEDKDYGRSCGVEDPQGNIWWITSVKG
ncbi:MAG: VOC family protein [Citrobacter freundii]|nr:MAG: VOC family protein [Citrobacter freundii]